MCQCIWLGSTAFRLKVVACLNEGKLLLLAFCPEAGGNQRKKYLKNGPLPNVTCNSNIPVVVSDDGQHPIFLKGWMSGSRAVVVIWHL